jgi:hypothetical protein
LQLHIQIPALYEFASFLCFEKVENLWTYPASVDAGLLDAVTAYTEQVGVVVVP